LLRLFKNPRTLTRHRLNEILKILEKIWRAINPRESNTGEIEKDDDADCLE